LVVLEQREGADLARAVALDAALLEDRLDVLVEGDLAGRRLARRSRRDGRFLDRAAGGLGGRHGRRLAREHGLDGIDEVVLRRRVLRVADAVLVVDGAA